MYKPEYRKVTAEEVKALPEGTLVTVHGWDRHGYSTETLCTVVQGPRSKQLRYFDDKQKCVKRMPIRTLDGFVHFYSVEAASDGV